MQAAKRIASAPDRGNTPVLKKARAVASTDGAALCTPDEGSEKRSRPTNEEVSPATHVQVVSCAFSVA